MFTSYIALTELKRKPASNTITPASVQLKTDPVVLVTPAEKQKAPTPAQKQEIAVSDIPKGMHVSGEEGIAQTQEDFFTVLKSLEKSVGVRVEEFTYATASRGEQIRSPAMTRVKANLLMSELNKNIPGLAGARAQTGSMESVAFIAESSSSPGMYKLCVYLELLWAYFKKVLAQAAEQERKARVDRQSVVPTASPLVSSGITTVMAEKNQQQQAAISASTVQTPALSVAP